MGITDLFSENTLDLCEQGAEKSLLILEVLPIPKNIGTIFVATASGCFLNIASDGKFTLSEMPKDPPSESHQSFPQVPPKKPF